MYEQSTEDQVREMARRRLLQLDSLDQRDGLRKLFKAYKTRTGKCPDSWRELEPVFRAVRIPVDQSGAPLGSFRSALRLASRQVRSPSWI